MKEIHYDRIKSKAKRALSEAMRAGLPTGMPNDYSVDVLLSAMPLALGQLLSDSGMEEGVNVVTQKVANRSYETPIYLALAQIVEEWERRAHLQIEDWDVRNIRKLVELFPQSVPKQCRNWSISAYIADTDDSPWIVVFEPRKSLSETLH